ncbi:MAG TPA: DoxX family protein [Gemmatimonadaceae bacterium]|jgi:putative oxidoreductase|nr:DoxX family protein [Gemmatimonadaceae bacterium]
MLSKIIRTSDDKVLTVLRLALAIVVFPHGAQKVLGWFGGFGPSGTYGFLTQQMHIPGVLVILVFAAEFLGPIGLFVGFLSRIAAFGIAVDFAVALFMVHLPNGFFMNWSGQQKGEGIEFFFLAIGIAIAIMIGGGGAFSIDRILTSKDQGQLNRTSA